ncbi:MAG: killer suppression protein [Thermodesulfobacteriota bacterium]
MDIIYKNERDRKLLNDHGALVRKFGKSMADAIINRQQQLFVSSNLFVFSKLPQTRCHSLTGDRDGELAADLIHPFRLVFAPDDNPLPETPDGGLDWTRVTTVKILRVEDYHGKRKKK